MINHIKYTRIIFILFIILVIVNLVMAAIEDNSVDKEFSLITRGIVTVGGLLIFGVSYSRLFEKNYRSIMIFLIVVGLTAKIFVEVIEEEPGILVTALTPLLTLVILNVSSLVIAALNVLH